MTSSNDVHSKRVSGGANFRRRRLSLANVWLIGCLAVAAFLAVRSFVTTQSESRANVEPNPVAATSRTAEKNIEDLRVGDRLAPVTNPGDDFDDSLGQKVEPETWRKLKLRARKDDGTDSQIELLRPLWWIEQESAEIGGRVYISVPECGIDGNAEVLAIESCPPIQTGDGPVVTGTFAHQSAEVLNVYVKGLDEPIGATANHPFWSDTLRDFVEAGELRPGERLYGVKGNPRITKVLPRGPPEPVYNIEVFGEHVYQISSCGLLVHNGGPCPPKEQVTVFRQGTFADEAAGWNGNYVKGRQWATDNPLTTTDYAKRYGLPAENTGNPDWIVGGRATGPYSTRPAPPSHNSPLNTGGATEVIPENPGDVILDWFHMPDLP